MNKKKRMELFKDYHKSIDNKKHTKALKQNRQLYNEIFSAYDLGDENKEVLEGGLNQLEIEATDICKILGLIKLNPMEEK